ncbi:hypothetical protein DdX_17441 [Ditylenchus destructor]|uniref:Helitron helicase-like domain-containing protein n=1 Tax=Ditylenchus destructor TaxID=166010 RepID=A0AAD4MLQ3_9BILA|nr:hypothetical protein DdX_17441 [Ditylenchus destructor]
MPPKPSKPQVPMETRSRAKAKKNAETQPPVDAKRSRTDSRQAADEDDAPRREKTSECYKSESLKVDYFSRLLPRSDAVLNKIALNNSEMLQSVDIYSETAVDSHNDHSRKSNSELAFGCENDFLNLDTDFTVNNAVELLNEMYNKWLETNSRSSTADTSIKAFISHCNFNDPEIFETLSSNAGVDSDALIAAFENGTNLNATVSNNDLSHEFACVVSTDELNIVTANNDNTPIVKSRGRPKGKTCKSVNLKYQNSKDKKSHNKWQQKYLENQTPGQREKRLSSQSEYQAQKIASESAAEKSKRLSDKSERQAQKIASESAAEKSKRLSDQSQRQTNVRNRRSLEKNSRKKSEILLGTVSNVNDISAYSLRSFDYQCISCSALHFKDEAKGDENKKGKNNRIYDMCCSLGKIELENPQVFPPVLKSLFLKQHPKHREFYDFIRNLNSSFSFVSLKAHVRNLKGQYHYRIQGPLYHLFNTSAHPNPGQNPSYGQLFFLDTQQASNLRAIHFGEKLLHQWGVDMWTRIEEDLLEFQKKKNSSMKSAKAANVEQSFVDEETDDIARKHILYSDYPGSIKYYQEQFRKSMIMAKRIGPPDLFITITIGSDNEDLKKTINIQLTDEEAIQQQTNFRPDMVARAFEPSFKLTQNQRVNPEEVEFVETLQKLGDGQMQDGDEGHFEFPPECLSDNVINDVYGTALATKNYDALHEREMLSLPNKRALSSSLAGFAELAVGTAWTSLLGKFASADPINCRKHKASLHALFPGSSLDNSSLALQHLLLWLLRLNSV